MQTLVRTLDINVNTRLPLATDYTTFSDEDLISAITQEDSKKDLFKILHDRYSDKVYRKCISFVHDEDTAKDMVQEILTKVYTQLHKFKGKSRFSTWLYAITYNYCVEYYRRNSRFSKVDIMDGPDMADPGEENKELLSFRVEKLKRALNKVGEEDREILLMKYQRDSSIKDLMIALDISESAVKMRLARARKRVKKLVVEAERRSN